MSLDPLYVLLREVSVQVHCPFFNWIFCLPITRGRGGGNGRKKGKGHQGACIKDQWRKAKGGRIEGGRWGGGAGESDGGKMETTLLEQQ